MNINNKNALNIKQLQMHNAIYSVEATSFNTFHDVHIHKTSNIHPVQAFDAFKIIYEANTISELNTIILILRRSFPTTSYVAAMFHPTIGQCAHQSLNITTTLELGMIPTRK